MSKRSAKKTALAAENLCGYCLFFQAYPSGRHLQGNCTYYKQWIENAYQTTCSDMAKAALKENGIYRLVPTGSDSWIYVRRERKLRTRLFLVKK